MKLVHIAWRNVDRQKRRSTLLAAAMGFGLMVIILVQSFTTGLVSTAQDSFSSMLGGHIYISGEMLSESGRTIPRIDDTEPIDEVLPQFEDSIASYQKRSSADGMFIFNSTTTRGRLYGVDWREEAHLRESLEVIAGELSGLSDTHRLVISESLAQELGLILNERVIFSFKTVTGQANVGEFTISAIVRDGDNFGIGGMAYADREILNSLLGMEAGEYQSLNIRLKDISTMKAVAAGFEREIAKLAPVKVTEEADAGPMGMAKAGPMRMMSSFGSAVEESWEGTRFTVKTLDDYMGMISQLVGVLNGIALGLFFVLLLITMVGLVNTFRMIMIERTREIGTMRAVGVSRRSVRTLFLWEALFLSLKGSFYGITAAAVLGTMIRLIPFSPEGGLRLMLQEGHVRMPIEPVSIIAATLILSGAVLAATWMPARKASRVRPVDALRG